MRVGTCRGSLPALTSYELQAVPLEFGPLIRVTTNLDLDVWSAPLSDLVDEFSSSSLVIVEDFDPIGSAWPQSVCPSTP